MLRLTDRPQTTAAFLPIGGAWSPCRTTDLSSTARSLWDLLGGATGCWRCATATPDLDPDRLAILIDRAPSSQFDTLQAALRAGIALPDGLICLALTGSGFRGQRQRSWTALRGNLHLVAHYRLDLPAASVEAGLIMLPVVAAIESIRRTSDGRCAPTIKWVNDLILPAGKVGGVLTYTQIEGSRIVAALFGIGINLERAPVIVPTPCVPSAAALAAADPGLRGKLPELSAMLVSVLDEGMRGLRRDQGPGDLYQRYRAWSACIGREVGLWPASCDDPDRAPLLARSRVADVLPDLSLLLDGCAEPIRNARLALLPPTLADFAPMVIYSPGISGGPSPTASGVTGAPMENPNLLLICLNAFVAVLGLLWVLAIALRGLIELFPEKAPPKTDTAVAVAIASAANAILPGARVTHIEEIR